MAAELFGPADVPKTVGFANLRSLDLTAEEGFLLSRIDGRTSVKGLLALVSWDKDKTFALLESLLRKHLVNFDRAEIHDRVTAGAGQTNSGPGPSNGSQFAKPAAAPSITVDRSKLEKVPDLDEERCAEIVEWEQRTNIAQTLYEMFGLPDGADVRSVKREYRQLAMKFHPDKFFRKEIGGYRDLIDAGWKKIQEAYEKLTDVAQKEAYDAEILARGGRRPAPAPPPPSPAAAPSNPGASTPPAAKPWMAPPAPPASQPSSGSASAPLPTVPNPDPRPKMESAFERKIRQEVRERVEKALRHFEQAQADYKDKKYVSADSNLKMALQFDPKNETFLAWQASVKGVLEENLVAGLLRKGELAELSHDSKASQEAYEHAVSLYPDNVAANRALGLCLLAKGDPNVRRMKDCLQKVVAAKPKDFEAVLGLAKTLRLMGMLKNAQRVLDQAKELAPKDARVIEEGKELKNAAK